ncbi:MAG: sulfite exporter TauE/SafE family protein [Verrucomicrobiales bacterium]|nr:sulfite exporter TauE/SafE family protein [Verrucomicrobiales bacterium]
MHDLAATALAALGVLFIGLSKAGFGGGMGMLTMPLCVVAFGAKDALGILLPLLCAGDAFSLYYFWGKWQRRNLVYLLPSVFVGVIIGVRLIGQFSPRELNIAIGTLAVLFVSFQFVKETIFRAEGVFSPNHFVGVPVGLAAGITSTFAHGAGPIVSLFLIPQKMPKEIYAGTTILVFTWINWIKLVFFLAHQIVTRDTIVTSLHFFPLVPIGVVLGVWLNRRISEQLFCRLIYAFTFAAGLQLIFNFHFGHSPR